VDLLEDPIATPVTRAPVAVMIWITISFVEGESRVQKAPIARIAKRIRAIAI
jgi:hypothetical protein